MLTKLLLLLPDCVLASLPISFILLLFVVILKRKGVWLGNITITHCRPAHGIKS